MSESTHLSPDVLRHLYINEKLSKGEVAHKLGISYMQVRYRLAQFGIPMRSHREAGAISAHRYLKKSQPIICPVCGIEFQVAAYRLKRSKVICCSWGCGRELRLLQFKEASTKRLIRHRPTKPEQVVIDLLARHFPQFKFNGNGELGVTLARMIPDFVNVNGKKQVIEVFGDYYHTVLASNWKQTELGKTMAYNSVGYNCLVLWQSEIKSKSEAELVDIIGKFTARRHRR